MRAVRLSLIAVIGVALLAGGIFPPEHLHHSTATRPPVVHSHFDLRSTAGPHHSGLFNVEDDDHHTAIDIAPVMAAGPRTPSHRAPALVPVSAPVPALHVVLAALPEWPPADTPSPPPRLAASRAPPA